MHKHIITYVIYFCQLKNFIRNMNLKNNKVKCMRTHNLHMLFTFVNLKTHKQYKFKE